VTLVPVPITELKQERPLTSLRQAAVRVPAVTVTFWITMGLTAGMAESGSDSLVHRLAPVAAVVISGIALLAALVLQFAAGRYVPWIYWLALALVGLFGAVAANAVQVGLGVPPRVSAAFLACLLAILFAFWRATETTVSIHSIYTTRREVFYWAVVMDIFALGTAAGDLTAVRLHLGYLSSAVLFAIVVAVPAAARRAFGLNSILAFWLAYIVTRLLGASLADWMGLSHAAGGLDVGAGPVSLALVVLIAGFVAYMTDNPTSEGVADKHVIEDAR
jgi:uncharacterized membrane-anchored protein